MSVPSADPRTPCQDILLVEDEPEVRELVAEYLRGRGFRVATASNGRSAIAELQRAPGHFGLVLTDLHLPGADGLAVLRAARQLDPAVYVVIITGYASLDSAIQAVRHGAYDYITKPFALGQIDVLLQRIEDRRALEAENRRLLRHGMERQADAVVNPADRLSALEARMASLEAAVRELIAEYRFKRP